MVDIGLVRRGVSAAACLGLVLALRIPFGKEAGVESRGVILLSLCGLDYLGAAILYS